MKSKSKNILQFLIPVRKCNHNLFNSLILPFLCVNDSVLELKKFSRLHKNIRYDSLNIKCMIFISTYDILRF